MNTRPMNTRPMNTRLMNTRLMIALLTLQAWLAAPSRKGEDRGSVSTEQAIVTGAIVLLATIVVAAITAYAEGKLSVFK